MKLSPAAQHTTERNLINNTNTAWHNAGRLLTFQTFQQHKHHLFYYDELLRRMKRGYLLELEDQPHSAVVPVSPKKPWKKFKFSNLLQCTTTNTKTNTLKAVVFCHLNKLFNSDTTPIAYRIPIFVYLFTKLSLIQQDSDSRKICASAARSSGICLSFLWKLH